MATPSSARRAEWARQVGDQELHRTLMADLDCLRSLEGSPAAVTAPLGGWVRVAAWNVERGRDPGQAAAVLRACRADICLLSELDSGMARTDNKDVAAEIATSLGASYAYGVEFVELGIGDTDERRSSQGSGNARGLHGNAVLAATLLEAPDIVRLDEGGEWFATGSDQPRIGARMAVVATVAIEGTPVHVASTHLENLSDPSRRAAQLQQVLDAVDARRPGSPAIVGGDLNTFGATFEELADRRAVSRLRQDDPTRFSWPVEHEQLFEVAAARGFSWIDANVAAPTTSHGGDGLPDHVPLKLDWLLVRGMEAARPTVFPAIGPDGQALSDHHIVAASVRFTQP
jgi:endonuclease/exonuclease/phosphatase family metal-dependent hydrolase